MELQQITSHPATLTYQAATTTCQTLWLHMDSWSPLTPKPQRLPLAAAAVVAVATLQYKQQQPGSAAMGMVQEA